MAKTVTDMSRRTDLKNQSVVQKTPYGDFTVTYNSDGYATKASNNNYDPSTGTFKNGGSKSGGGGGVYDDMIDSVDAFYQKQINAVQQHADKQAQIQQERTDFAIEQIEQQKDQTKQDYTKEQSGAYVDWQKQSAEYGANAEAMADMGMSNTGYSESSQVSMYNQYQSRVATARESYSRAILNYDNAIKDARLQNNAALAEIAYNALKTQLELSLEGFQYKNSLIQEQTKLNLEIENQNWGRYMDVLDQINTENALAEEQRQFNEKMAEERRQYNTTLAEQKRQYNSTLALEKAQLDDKPVSGGRSYTNAESSSKKSRDNSAYYTTKKDKTAANKKASSLTVDEASITALGFGKLTNSQLNAYISRGYVQEYVSNGKLIYKLSPAGKRYKLMYSQQ